MEKKTKEGSVMAIASRMISKSPQSESHSAKQSAGGRQEMSREDTQEGGPLGTARTSHFSGHGW